MVTDVGVWTKLSLDDGVDHALASCRACRIYPSEGSTLARPLDSAFRPFILIVPFLSKGYLRRFSKEALRGLKNSLGG